MLLDFATLTPRGAIAAALTDHPTRHALAVELVTLGNKHRAFAREMRDLMAKAGATAAARSASDAAELVEDSSLALPYILNQIMADTGRAVQALTAAGRVLRIPGPDLAGISTRDWS